VKNELGTDPVIVLGDSNAQAAQRLQHLDAQRPDVGVHPLHAEHSRNPQIVLHAVGNDAERAVHHVQMRIDPERRRKETRPIGRVAVEEITVVKIPVRPRISDRLGCLMDGKIVGFGEHLPHPL